MGDLGTLRRGRYTTEDLAHVLEEALHSAGSPNPIRDAGRLMRTSVLRQLTEEVDRLRQLEENVRKMTLCREPVGRFGRCTMIKGHPPIAPPDWLHAEDIR
jgi:hypothetical protein